MAKNQNETEADKLFTERLRGVDTFLLELMLDPRTPSHLQVKKELEPAVRAELERRKKEGR